MREVGSFEAKTHLARLLDEVAAGGEVVITRRGRPVARLVPAAGTDLSLRQAAAARIRALGADIARQTDQPLDAAAILAARDEGRA